MRALTVDANRNLTYTTVPDPRITREDEVLLEIKATGICGTDIHILSGNYPAKAGIVLGHESTGVVREVGAGVRRFRKGNRVVLDPTFFCGMCVHCMNDRPNYCVEKSRTETGVSADGTFAELHVAREGFVHHLPEELGFDEGTMSEPLSCCINGLRQTRVRPESHALVVGAGPMGLLFAAAMEAMGCDVTIGDVEPFRLAQAAKVCTKVHDLRGDGLETVDGGRRPDLIVDTSGRMLERLLKRIEKGGDILCVGLDYGYEVTIKPSQLTDNGIRIIGSIDSNNTFAPAIEMLRRFPAFRQIVTHRLPLAEYREAFDVLGVNLETKKRGAIRGTKVVLQPWT